jgi:hypothetical protein
MDCNLSITVDMLKNIWAKNMEKPVNEYTDNKVTLVHPNGWFFSLGKFRTIPCFDYYRVRMYIQYKVFNENKEEFRCFNPFVRIFFGVDLDDCSLEELQPILEWCEKHRTQELIDSFSKE